MRWKRSGMLHILYTAILFLFWRVFLRISYQCPPHLEFSMDLMDWSEVVTLSHDCVRWLSIGNNDRVCSLFPLLVQSCEVSVKEEVF